MEIKYIFRTSGIYIAFIQDGNIFSRDGVYLGWLDGRYVWDAEGNFKGELYDDRFILRNQLVIPASSRPPRSVPSTPPLPNSPINILPYTPPIGYIDAF